MENGRYGSVLFGVERELDISDFGHAMLIHPNAKRLQDREWGSTRSGGTGSYEPDRILAEQDPMRVTIGIATPDVAAIRLR
jgi:hypothetical protein